MDTAIVVHNKMVTKLMSARNGRSLNNVELVRITVDTGARWHIVNDVEKFKSFDGPNVRREAQQTGTSRP